MRYQSCRHWRSAEDFTIYRRSVVRRGFLVKRGELRWHWLLPEFRSIATSVRDPDDTSTYHETKALIDPLTATGLSLAQRPQSWKLERMFAPCSTSRYCNVRASMGMPSSRRMDKLSNPA